MENLNKDQLDQLDSLLLKTIYDLDDVKAIVKLYILVRKGVDVTINLEKGMEKYPIVMKRFAMQGQAQELMSAQADALEWFGLNYKKND